MCPGECGARFRALKCSGYILRSSYEVWLRLVQFLLFAVDGSDSRILLLGVGHVVVVELTMAMVSSWSFFFEGRVHRYTGQA